MSDAYRERVWQAIANSLSNATGHYGDVCDTVREAVMAVRDAELTQSRTERDQVQTKYSDLLAQRDQWWDFVGKRRAVYSDLLRGMARRVDAWRASRRVLEAQVWKQGELIAALRAQLGNTVTLPEDWQRQVSDALNADHQYVPSTRMIGLVESWRETTP